MNEKKYASANKYVAMITGCFQLPVSRRIVASVARQWGAKIYQTKSDIPVASPHPSGPEI